MKKTGFTLPELLLVLLIIGVVAAMTIPTLVRTYKSSFYDAARKTAEADLESGMKHMIYREDVNDLYQTKAWRAVSGGLNGSTSESAAKEFMGNISQYVEITGSAKYADYFSDDSDEYNDMRVFTTKKGPVYLISIPASAAKRIAQSDAYAEGTTLTQQAATVVIDVNGNKQNSASDEKHSYVLGADGTLYSSDSKDVTEYNKLSASEEE